MLGGLRRSQSSDHDGDAGGHIPTELFFVDRIGDGLVNRIAKPLVPDALFQDFAVEMEDGDVYPKVRRRGSIEPAIRNPQRVDGPDGPLGQTKSKSLIQFGEHGQKLVASDPKELSTRMFDRGSQCVRDIDDGTISNLPSELIVKPNQAIDIDP